jgi:NDP-sugar pyrophosphorylase family protein
MILAGGMSTRLYPLTKQVPKPLVPVAGIPNAVHLIKYLQAHDCTEIAINVHYLADLILQTLGDGSQYGVKLTYLHEDALMGSAGSVKAMETFLSGDNFFVVGCDDLTDLPLDELMTFHQRNGAIATIGLVAREEVDQYGVVVVDEIGRITGFQEKPPKGTERSKLANTGIYAFSPEIFNHIPASRFYDFGNNVFPALQQAGEAFFGFDAGGAYWCDIGTIAEYRRASLDVVEGRFALPGGEPTGIDAGADVAPSARIEGRVLIRAGASIAEDAVVTGPSVIDGGVRVGKGARVQRSILWQGASIGEGARVRDSVVGLNYRVEPAVELAGAVVANEESSG